MKPSSLQLGILLIAFINFSNAWAGPGVGGIIGKVVDRVVNRVAIGNPQMLGDGCPAGTVQAVVSPTGDTVSILFSQFEINKLPEAAPTVMLRNTCRVSVPFAIPAGQRLQAFRVDYRGYLHIEGNRQVRFIFTSAPMGTAGGGMWARIRPQDTMVTAPYDGPLEFSHNLGPIRLPQCGGTANIELGMSMMITGAGVKGSAPITGTAISTIDSADAVVATQDNGMHLRIGLVPCN